ncbi:hypothetical protein HYY69_02815 [Candidatus Woesearchaeota archaeon]|nr:hypothetical protein [Candidatus Woesearchaeota archaeon]
MLEHPDFGIYVDAGLSQVFTVPIDINNVGIVRDFPADMGLKSSFETDKKYGIPYGFSFSGHHRDHIQLWRESHYAGLVQFNYPNITRRFETSNLLDKKAGVAVETSDQPKYTPYSYGTSESSQFRRGTGWHP